MFSMHISMLVFPVSILLNKFISNFSGCSVLKCICNFSRTLPPTPIGWDANLLQVNPFRPIN